MPQTRSAAVLLSLLCLAPAVQALDATRAEVRSFIGELQQRHGFDAEVLSAVLAKVESKQFILDAIARPAEKTMPWHEYRSRFLIERRIARGVEVWQAQSEALALAVARGVPAEVILGIIGVETFYGENTGKHRVADALATLAFDYPPRSSYFRGELEQFLLMAREESLDPLAPTGSYAGAMGIPQFMPTSFRKFSVDGDGDGRRDLWRNWSDVFGSVANYLVVHGWKSSEPLMATADVATANLEGLDLQTLALTETVGSLRARGVRFETTLPDTAPALLIDLVGTNGLEYRVGFQNFYSITRYNRSELYASAVTDLAAAIGAARAAVPEKPAEVAAAR